MFMFIAVAAGALLALVLAAIVITMMSADGSRLEVEPAEACVIKNRWTGRARALFAGSHVLVPWQDQVLQRVSLRNDPSDPPIQEALTADGIHLGLDFIIQTQVVVDDEAAALAVVLNIDYDKRGEIVLQRIASAGQDALAKKDMPTLRRGTGMIHEEEQQEIEDAINLSLEELIDEIGIKVHIELENIIPPADIQQAATETEIAAKRGAAIKSLAEAAGVKPEWVIGAEAVVEIAKALRGEEKS